MSLPLMQPIPVAAVSSGLRLRIIGAAGAGFPSPAQDWADDAISLIELLRLDRAASFVFRISGSSMVDAGLHDNDVVVVDRDVKPGNGRRRACLSAASARLTMSESRASASSAASSWAAASSVWKSAAMVAVRRGS